MTISFWPKAYSLAKMLRDCIESKTSVHYILSNRGPSTINYGNSEVESNMNSPEFIKLCVNKLAFSQLMSSNDIPSPEFFRGVPTTFPCLIREQIGGFSGHGSHTFQTKEEYDPANLNPNFIWSPWVRCVSEYRVHVLGGNFVKCFKKVPTHEEDILPIRNSYV